MIKKLSMQNLSTLSYSIIDSSSDDTSELVSEAGVHVSACVTK